VKVRSEECRYAGSYLSNVRGDACMTPQGSASTVSINATTRYWWSTDNFVVLCKHGAAEALEEIQWILSKIGLTTTVMRQRRGVKRAREAAFDFLGYTFQMLRSLSALPRIQRDTCCECRLRSHVIAFRGTAAFV
jgi:hypothetical protein